MLDATGDGSMDLVLMQSGPQAIRVLHSKAAGGFEDWDAEAAGLKASGHAVACAVGDYDGDGLNDLAVALDDKVLLFRNLGKGKFQDVTTDAGLVPRNRPTGITFVDYDHDGDLDLLITGSPLAPAEKTEAGTTPATPTSNVLWRNNGNKTFTEWTEPTGLGGGGNVAAAILTDFNNDRAVDLAMTGDGPAPLIYINPREGKYPTQPLYDDNLPPTTGITVLDFNKDGWMDIAVTHAGAPGLTLWRNVEGPNHIGRRFERVDLPLNGAVRGWGVTAVDIDNDGWIDLAAIVETKAGPQVRVLRNRGDGSFEDVSQALGLDKVVLKAPRGLISGDMDGKGAPDLLVTQVGEPPVLLHNEGANKHHSVRLDLAGLADNKTAIGAKVEIFSNGHWQKWELAGASGYQTQAAPRASDRARRCAGYRSAAHPLAHRRSPGRDRSAQDSDHRHERGRPPRKLVSGALRVGWPQISAGHGCHRGRGGRALVHPAAAEYSQPRRMGQGRWRAHRSSRWKALASIHRADGGSQLHRPVATRGGRSP